MRWLRLFFWFQVALLVGLGVTGALYQSIENAKDARRFPQPGRLIDIGRARLRLDCGGSGAVTVLLESGLGIPGRGWARVQPEVEKFARVCSYDRAGYGSSSPRYQPRTVLAEAQELHAALQKAGEHGPYVIAGHSLGGFIARAFTGQYPAEVQGLVLIDASHEDQRAKFGPPPYGWRMRLTELAAPILLRFGAFRVLRAMHIDIGSHLPGDPALASEIEYLEFQPSAVATIFAELRMLDQSIGEVRAAGSLGDRPLIVLTAGRESTPEWLALQQSLAKLSSRSRQITVPDSGHLIPLERPGAVVNAIRQAVYFAPNPR